MIRPSVVDFIGNRIQIGDTVAYPVRRRSEMVLKRAIVRAMPNDNGIECLKEDGQRVNLRHPARCIVISRLEKL